MHHFMKMTDPWRMSFCAHRNDGPIDEPCDALTVKWLTKTHIWVSVVTNLLLPWRYYASSIWQYMTHPWRTIPGGQEVRLTNDTCIIVFKRMIHNPPFQHNPAPLSKYLINGCHKGTKYTLFMHPSFSPFCNFLRTWRLETSVILKWQNIILSLEILCKVPL